MLNLLKSIKSKIFSSGEEPSNQSDHLIALGVLLRAVAEADDHYHTDEQEVISQRLISYADISPDDLPIVLRAVKEATLQSIDLFEFTREINEQLDHDTKKSIIHDLFLVALADEEIQNDEHEIIRKIAKLLTMSHDDFISAKMEAKKAYEDQK